VKQVQKWKSRSEAVKNHDPVCTIELPKHYIYSENKIT